MNNDDLIKLGFIPIPHFTIGNSVTYDLGRCRLLSASSVGTPNEMIFIIQTDDDVPSKISDIICLHNYDYDGYITEEKIKLYMSLK